MPPTELTSRERMHRMLERRDHDRVPRHDGYWPETIARWQKEGLEGGPLRTGRRTDSSCNWWISTDSMVECPIRREISSRVEQVRQRDNRPKYRE